MDDYSISSLVESKNEWCARLVSILSNTTITGIMAIFKEAIALCENDGNETKYLMTFQNLLSRIPQWNPSIIETERKRIETESRCKYIEDLITCVHIIQLKALTCVRVGQKQKKIDLDIPSVDKFIHQVYINVARKLYTNIYLFEKDILPLQIQKNNRELELLVKESILLTIRNNIPIEDMNVQGMIRTKITWSYVPIIMTILFIFMTTLVVIINSKRILVIYLITNTFIV